MIENLCKSAVVLYNGEIIYVGRQSEAIARYLKSLTTNHHSLDKRTDRMGSGALRVTGIEIRDALGNVVNSVGSGQSVDIYFYFETKPGFRSHRVIASLIMKTQLDVPVFLHHNRLTRDEFGGLPESGAFVCCLPRLPLPPSTYRIGYTIMVDDEYLDSIGDAAELTVVSGDFFGSGEVPPISHGVCLVEGKWRLSPVSGPSHTQVDE
jgi:lipopolysaccharide transport system ATP-binding protein